jgi:hypothetical protein
MEIHQAVGIFRLSEEYSASTCSVKLQIAQLRFRDIEIMGEGKYEVYYHTDYCQRSSVLLMVLIFVY